MNTEATKICNECKKEKPIELFKHSSGCYRQTCRACRGRWERLKIRIELILAYGAQCVCCNEKEVRFLTLDHINNDGNIEREDLKEHQIYYKAKREGFPKDRYQLLCFNCNSAKSIFGKCPHQK